MKRLDFEDRWSFDEGDIETAQSYGCPKCGERFCTETESRNITHIFCEECTYWEAYDEREEMIVARNEGELIDVAAERAAWAKVNGESE